MNLNNDFILTKEYKRFSEFCNACHREKIIGLCYGPPGVGKTASAYQFSKWNELLFHFESIDRSLSEYEPLKNKEGFNTVVYTPSVSITAAKIEYEIEKLLRSFNEIINFSIYGTFNKIPVEAKKKQYAEILIIDEADRLPPKGLEEIRDLYDRKFTKLATDPQLTVILIGMPGIEKRLVRFAQLYSRIGFVHSFKTLSEEEVIFIIQNQCKSIGIDLGIKDFSDQEAIATVTRITQGNFRLINRLLKQCIRVMQVNKLGSISKEVVEAARECLVIGNI